MDGDWSFATLLLLILLLIDDNAVVVVKFVASVCDVVVAMAESIVGVGVVVDAIAFAQLILVTDTLFVRAPMPRAAIVLELLTPAGIDILSILAQFFRPIVLYAVIRDWHPLTLPACYFYYYPNRLWNQPHISVNRNKNQWVKSVQGSAFHHHFIVWLKLANWHTE